ncbi:MAG: translation initiation factor IF-3 [Candidatus Spechtbacterales bacterium]
MPKPRKKRPQQQFIKKPKRNHQIRSPKVRVIDDSGENIGVLDLPEALKLAEKAELDLIEVSDKADPPVVRIMDYGKHIYQLEKKDKEAKKKQLTTNIIKGVRISMRTGDHDLEIKAQTVDKFLKKGYKVRVEVIMRGREKALKNMADKKIQEFLDSVTEEYKMDQAPQRYPRGLQFIISKP